MRGPKILFLFERKPWATALLSATGVTLLVPGAAALLAPPEVLDGLWSLGDRKLILLVCALFAGSAAFSRLLLRRRPADDDYDAEALLLAPPPPTTPIAGGHLR